MSDKEDTGLKDLATTTTRSAAAAALVAASGQPGAMVFAAALAAYLPLVTGFVFGVAWNHKKAEADRLWGEFLRRVAAEDQHRSVSDVEEDIRRRADEPQVRETIFRSVRALLDAVDDDATLPLARLMAEYHRNATKPDVFFRGAARLFAELSASEFNDLRRVVEWALETSTAPKIMLCAYDRDPIGDLEDWPSVPWRILLFEDDAPPLDKPDGILNGTCDPDRLLLLFENFGLATRAQKGWMGADPRRIDVARKTLERLARLLCD